MNEQSYYENQGGLYAQETGTSLANVQSMAPIAIGQSNNRAVRRIERRVEVAATEERAYARLSQEGIVNTGILVGTVEAIAAVIPSARTPCEHIANAYAAGVAERVNNRRF